MGSLGNVNRVLASGVGVAYWDLWLAVECESCRGWDLERRMTVMGEEIEAFLRTQAPYLYMEVIYPCNDIFNTLATCISNLSERKVFYWFAVQRYPVRTTTSCGIAWSIRSLRGYYAGIVRQNK